MKSIPETEIIDKRDGIFESIPFIPNTAAESLTEKYDIFAMIAGYENEAREVLKSQGYSETLDKQSWNKDRRYRDIIRMLTYFREVRIYIKMNEAARAALSMGYAIRCAMLARIRPIEPIIERGKKVTDGGKQGGEKSGSARREKSKPTKEAWRAEAQKIWQRDPKMSKSRAAELIKKKIGGNVGTIRKSI